MRRAVPGDIKVGHKGVILISVPPQIRRTGSRELQPAPVIFFFNRGEISAKTGTKLSPAGYRDRGRMFFPPAERCPFPIFRRLAARRSAKPPEIRLVWDGDSDTAAPVAIENRLVVTAPERVFVDL
jgi:hypothetical protein